MDLRFAAYLRACSPAGMNSGPASIPAEQPLWFLTGNQVPPLKMVSYILNNFSDGEQVYETMATLGSGRHAGDDYSA
jgi:hypothetical protein